MPSRDIKDCDQILQDCYPLLKAEYEKLFPGRELFLTCTKRSPEEQEALYKQGRGAPGPIVTQIDGVKKMSMHNYAPARAFDVGIKLHDLVVWGDDYFLPLGKCLKNICFDKAVRWGGEFSFHDYPHFEIRKQGD